MPDEVKARVKAELAELPEQMQSAGYGLTISFCGRDQVDQWSEQLKTLSPDAVVIGGGVRRIDTCTPLLEQIIEAVRNHAPQAKILFNTSPADTLSAVQRWFPLSK